VSALALVEKATAFPRQRFFAIAAARSFVMAPGFRFAPPLAPK
jgi:hypothetical protein